MRGYQRCFVVFPKLSSIEHKDLRDKQIARSVTSKWITNVTEQSGLSLVGFCEDVYLRSTELCDKYFSCVGEGDSTFAIRNMLDYFGETYPQDLQQCVGRISDSIISENIRRVKAPDRRTCFDALEYKTRRATTVYQRLRQNCNDFLKTEPFVLMFKSNKNMFCNSMLQECVIGDGKIYIEVDIFTDMEEIMYSGIKVSWQELSTILGGMKSGV